jgi:hypothetical protein
MSQVNRYKKQAHDNDCDGHEFAEEHDFVHEFL